MEIRSRVGGGTSLGKREVVPNCCPLPGRLVATSLHCTPSTLHPPPPPRPRLRSLVLDLEVEVAAEPVIEEGLLHVAGGYQLSGRRGMSGQEPKHRGPRLLPTRPSLTQGSHRPAQIPHWSLQKLPATLSCPALFLPAEGHRQPQGSAGRCRAHWAATFPGTKDMDLGSRLRRAPVASSGHPHLAAEPVTVGLLVNLHDDVVHLRDPHKPVALQEPGSELGSAQEPGMLVSTGPGESVGTEPPSRPRAAQGGWGVK